jgi:hypothetical protein
MRRAAGLSSPLPLLLNRCDFVGMILKSAFRIRLLPVVNCKRFYWNDANRTEPLAKDNDMAIAKPESVHSRISAQYPSR